MAKKIVKVNEEKIRGYMVGDIPDAIEKEDVIVVEVPAEETDKRPDKEKETASENPEPHPKRKSEKRSLYIRVISSMLSSICSAMMLLI